MCEREKSKYKYWGDGDGIRRNFQSKQQPAYDLINLISDFHCGGGGGGGGGGEWKGKEKILKI